jgi:cytosine permease
MSHGIIAAAYCLFAAFVGLKGIQYVARVATYLPLIPVAVLILLLVASSGGLKSFSLNKFIPAPKTESLEKVEDGSAQVQKVEVKAVDTEWAKLMRTKWGIMSWIITYIVGFFATAGAAGVDIASSSRNEEDVHIGGLGGVVLPAVISCEVVLIIIVGAYGTPGMIKPETVGSLNPVQLMPNIFEGWLGPKGVGLANIALIGLALSSFPGACFSSLIAANSFKTTMPKINPLLSVGVGALVAAFLAVSGIAGHVVQVFVLIGASFGPICGAILADYLLAGRTWSGPRAGFNPAGWISWIIGFAVGGFNLVVDFLLTCDGATKAIPHLADWKGYVPIPPDSAFVVGFVLYVALFLLGARTRTLDMPQTAR